MTRAHSGRSRGPARQGFTLIELLVVIATIAILIGQLPQQQRDVLVPHRRGQPRVRGRQRRFLKESIGIRVYAALITANGGGTIAEETSPSGD